MAPGQDEIDKSYWEDVLICKEPGCRKSYPHPDGLAVHMKRMHKKA